MTKRTSRIRCLLINDCRLKPMLLTALRAAADWQGVGLAGDSIHECTEQRDDGFGPVQYVLMGD
jgi:hypothetical protein